MNAISGFVKIRDWIKDNLVFFGPGLLLAITAAGESGVADAIEIGAHYGMALSWVVILTLIFKYAFTNGIARQTFSTGITIFESINKLPGPNHWGSYLIIAGYMIEMLAIGAMLMFSAAFLDYLMPGIYTSSLIAIYLLIFVLLIIRTRIYNYFEQIMCMFAIGLTGAVIICLYDFPFSLPILSAGFIPSIPTGSELAILAIIGIAGSGLNLMLYSVWLKDKVHKHDDKTPESCDVHNPAFFKKYIRSVNIDIAIGFIFVTVIFIGFMFLGFAGNLVAFTAHGTTLTLDKIITQTVYVFCSIPYGQYIFLGIVSVFFFGAAAIGLDSRARALTITVQGLLHDIGYTKISSSSLYQIALVLFSVVVVLAILFGNPLTILMNVAAVQALIFGIFGFIVIYLDSKLPDYAQGNRLWLLLVSIGSVASIYIALLIESAFLEYGFPLLERMFVIIIITLLFTRTDMYRKLIKGTAGIMDKIWAIGIFGMLSVYGVIRGVSELSASVQDTALYNFASVSPMIAGIIGGPFVGAGAGLIGCIARIVQGGELSVPFSLAILLSGILAGFAIRRWKGKLTLPRSILMGITVQCISILTLLPLYAIFTGTLTSIQILTVEAITLLPMIAVNSLGIAAFAMLTADVKVFAAGVIPIDIKKSIQEIKAILHSNKQELADENEKREGN